MQGEWALRGLRQEESREEFRGWLQKKEIDLYGWVGISAIGEGWLIM